MVLGWTSGNLYLDVDSTTFVVVGSSSSIYPSATRPVSLHWDHKDSCTDNIGRGQPWGVEWGKNRRIREDKRERALTVSRPGCSTSVGA